MGEKTRRSIGDYGEDLAKAYLEKKGYILRECNYQIKGGEIDLVMKQGELTVFVEVKYRKTSLYGHPLDTFTLPKRRALRRTLFSYIHKYKIDPEKIRVDFVGILGDGGDREYFHIEGVEV